MSWKAIKTDPPPTGVFVNTIISDGNGLRNEAVLKFEKNLWWGSDGNYIYYDPTHWKAL